jgi:ABC-2 type transport system permease protein
MNDALPVAVRRIPHQPSLGDVLAPKWRSALARSRADGRGRGARTILFLVVGGLFWTAAFGICYRVLKYVDTQEIGVLLASKMLGVIFLAFAAILLLSNLITALSSFFLARDLDLLVAAPLHWFRLYLAKLLETAGHSSWMVLLMAVPILTAYGIVFHGGPLFPFVALAALVPFLILPAVIGAAITLLLVNVFPARRIRDLLTLVALGAVGGLALLFRLVRPEQLARPEGFESLVEFLAVLRAPTNPFLPTQWATDMIMNWLRRIADPLPIVLLVTSSAAFVMMGGWLHGRLFRDGYSKSQEGAGRFVRGRSWPSLMGRTLAGLAPARREFLLKDIRIFFRDPTQWSQLILLGVLVVVYVFNIRSLPLFSGEKVPFFLVTIIVFLNLGLAGFVLTAVAARFIFPSVSLEGRQLWLIQSSPLRFRTLLLSKYWLGTVPLVVLALAITATTNLLLHASPFMMMVSCGTIIAFTVAASALALCLGAYYPKFDTENAAQIPTSFGGLIFMMSGIALLGLLIAIEALPVSAYMRAHQTGEAFVLSPTLLGALAAVLVVCVATAVIALRLASRRLDQLEH